MKQLARTIAFAVVLAASAAPVRAEDVKAGDLVISQAWSRQTPSGAKVAGGYLTIENKGTAADRLISGSGDVAGKVNVSLEVQGVGAQAPGGDHSGHMMKK